MKLILVCGHYGCGKTTFSIHLAGQMKQKYKTALVDLDIVNPYFRSSDYAQLPALEGVTVVAPSMAGTTLDAPALRPEIMSVFDSDFEAAVFDIGGDDAGATALGRFSPSVKQYDYQMLYVINRYRSQISEPMDALEILHEIERASRLKATGLINNSHLGRLTDQNTILSAVEYAEQVSDASGLPLLGTTAPAAIAGQLTQVKNLIPIEITVQPPWQV